MKCKHCHGTGKRFVSTNKNAITGNGYTADCLYCNGTGEIEMSHKEYIRTCNDEELAKMLYTIGFLDNITDDVMNIALMQNVSTEKAFELWLQEKHDELF